MNSSINAQIGEAIRSYLESKGLTQCDVAEKLGITQGAVSAYYRGKPFGKNAAPKWSDAFGFRVNWLLTGEGAMLIGDQPEVSAEEQPDEVGMTEKLFALVEDQRAEIKMLLSMLREKDTIIEELRKELDARKGGTAPSVAGSFDANVG